MADMEMELDPARSLAHDDPIDEDLISYDIDTDAMDGTAEQWAEEDLEIQDVEGNHAENDMGTLPDSPADDPIDAMDTLEVLPLSGTSANDADMLSDFGHDEVPIHEDTQQSHEDSTLENTVDENTTTTHEMVVSAAKGASDAPFDDVEEIDFETVHEVQEDSGLTSAALDADSQQPVDIADSESRKSDGAIPATAVPVGDDFVPVHTDEEELTWEEDEPNEPDAVVLMGEGVGRTPGKKSDEPKQTTSPTQSGAEAVEGSEEAELVDQIPSGHAAQGESGEEVGEDLGEDAGEDAGEVTGDGAFEQLQGATHEHSYGVQEKSPEEGQEMGRSPGTSRDAIVYPSITVQYKGEEFPCFSSADGFFTGTSVLRESIERLLAGFRAELTAELAPDEELVFHVDELGLEFAESTHHDILAGTTLQYVLDIHDMLVQNQDHDHENGSKSLYTYLFTRSSTSKRLEFLAESAANGKGLDEVIHLFEPGMSHHNVDQSLDQTVALLDEHGDDYPSPGDEPAGNDGSGNDEDDAVHEPQLAVAEEASARAPAEVPKYDPTLAAAAGFDDAIKAIKDDGQQSSGTAATIDGPASPQEDAQLAPEEVPEQTITDAQDDFDDALDPVVMALGQEAGQQATEAPSTATSNSSTVDGTEMPLSSATGGIAGDEVNGADTQPLDPDEDELEIDWRDDGGEAEDAEPGEDQTTPAKRARADDDLYTVEENDAKRQRSS